MYDGGRRAKHGDSYGLTVAFHTHLPDTLPFSLISPANCQVAVHSHMCHTRREYSEQIDP